MSFNNMHKPVHLTEDWYLFLCGHLMELDFMNANEAGLPRYF